MRKIHRWHGVRTKTKNNAEKFLAQGGMTINQEKTKMTASTDEFVFLG
jgi:hypothetical protein